MYLMMFDDGEGVHAKLYLAKAEEIKDLRAELYTATIGTINYVWTSNPNDAIIFYCKINAKDILLEDFPGVEVIPYHEVEWY